MEPIGFLDVAYAGDSAGVACVLAEEWDSEQAVVTAALRLAHVAAPYQPGELYLRELPLLQALLIRLDPLPRILVVDAYVWLGDRRPGLGAHLWEALGGEVPVVGVAKSRYHGDNWSTPVLRGSGRRPLHVTAAGVEQTQAAGWIARMHGKDRIPVLLREVDALSRSALRLETTG